LRFLQDAFAERLSALAKLAGDKTVITGVVITDGEVSNGFITYNNEIIPFQGGNVAETVTIIEEFENVNYNTDSNNDQMLDNLPAYRTIYARCGTGGIDIFPFSDLKPLKTIKELSEFELPSDIVQDANYVHTDHNFTLALLQKLNGIESGAEVNVQADWNNTAPSSDQYILNKPFSAIRFSHGQMTTTARDSTNYNAHLMATRFDRNVAYVYPPFGYTLSNLVAFMPSLGIVHFDNDVNHDDTLFCNYQVDYVNNRINVICNNSENRASSVVNYFAVWIKY